MRVEITTPWLLLILSLPTHAATARMRVWRALKACGCAALRDGAYLLPDGHDREPMLRDLGAECDREGGSAWLMRVSASTNEEDLAYRQLFDRSEPLLEQRRAWRDVRKGLRSHGPQELARLYRRLQREYEALRAVDFFPSDASAETEADWVEFGKHVQAVLAPDEPLETAGSILRLDLAPHQGRTWATRRGLGVDRVASAWLIRRFIDPQARFRWLAKVSDCPRRALGFDFDGADFTHVGDRVTFETLLASFGLDGDPALQCLGAMVHALDVGGEAVPQASGFEAVLAGARERLPDDDALLAEMTGVLDSLYTHFNHERPRKATKGGSR